MKESRASNRVTKVRIRWHLLSRCLSVQKTVYLCAFYVNQQSLKYLLNEQSLFCIIMLFPGNHAFNLQHYLSRVFIAGTHIAYRHEADFSERYSAGLIAGVT